MNEAHDPLESELSALRPHGISPGLRRRVAERLADFPRAKLRRLWRIALAGGLAAACLATVLFRWGGGRDAELKLVVYAPQPGAPVEAEDSWPTLLEYQRALARSPDELDALLNKHAIVAPEPNPALVRICAFTRSDSTLHALLGDD